MCQLAPAEFVKAPAGSYQVKSLSILKATVPDLFQGIFLTKGFTGNKSYWFVASFFSGQKIPSE
jgi:hypothetical protein